MPRKPKSFGLDVGVDLCRCSVTVFEGAVFVVQFGESLGQGQSVPEALVDPEGQLAWCQLAGQHPGGECSCGGFLPGGAAHRVEGEAQFVECRGEEIGTSSSASARVHAAKTRRAGLSRPATSASQAATTSVARISPVLQSTARSWSSRAAGSVDGVRP
ncbi:hypothetical protein [Streptomyces sp. enrichment culture]|uniref:hypothetical protein n=1 Tax=Streptomyces sp. enrichment culture TaxID=1795815 RepID=UPI003F5562DC